MPITPLLGLLIEDAGYEVEITKGVGGGTSNIQPAMEAGEFDLYPEYTSSGWVMVLDHKAEGMDDDEMFTQLQQEYEENFGMTWVGLYGFNTTFTVAVRADVAEHFHPRAVLGRKDHLFGHRPARRKVPRGGGAVRAFQRTVPLRNSHFPFHFGKGDLPARFHAENAAVFGIDVPPAAAHKQRIVLIVCAVDRSVQFIVAGIAEGHIHPVRDRSAPPEFIGAAGKIVRQSRPPVLFYARSESMKSLVLLPSR